MSVRNKGIHNIWIYFGITFGVAWLFWVPGILRTYVFPTIPKIIILVFAIAATFVPSIVGLIFVGIESKREGILDLLKRAVQFRGYRWGITSLLLYPIMIALAHAINYGIWGIPIPITDLLRNDAWKIPFVFLMGIVIRGPLGEEFGWRGYALPKLQQKFGAWISAVMLGLLWGLWYIPAFFIDGTPQRTMPLLPFLVTDLLFTFIIAWQQNVSRNSLVPAFLLHGMMNFTMETMPLMNFATGEHSAWWIANGLLGIICLFILIFTHPKNFSSRFDLQPKKATQDQ